MRYKNNGNVKLIRKFITEHPNIKSTRGRTVELMKLYPDVFVKFEQTRSGVRATVGQLGAKSRRQVKDPEKLKFFNGFDKWANENLEVELRPWDEPYQIPTGIKQLNIIADLHSIHLDKKVMTAFLKQTSDKEAVLINGDLMDSESLSRHLKGHNVIEYEKELEICHQILKGLKEEFTHVFFKAGNHDFWLDRYLLSSAREVFRALGTNLFQLLRCNELGVHTIHNLKYVSFGDLDIIHGHEFAGFGGGKFPSVSLCDKWQSFKHKYDIKVMQAHSHRSDHTISRKSKDGKFSEAWAMPAMCRKGAGFSPYAGWDNGWAVAFRGENGVEFKNVVL